ncbi:glycosyltransferase family 2 protein [Vibrio breoganii]
MKITIFTPTYNRRDLLERLYNSLNIQNILNFEWVIVDDGSSDDTELFIETIKSEAKFDIIYIKQVNSGKHIAINKGFEVANGYWFMIVDSDDYLLPDCVDNYTRYLDRHENDNKIATVVFLRSTPDLTTIGECFPDENKPKNLIQRNEMNIHGDKCEVIKLSKLENLRFPQFNNETFMAESYLWLSLGKKYDAAFYNIKGYICDYQDGGLTSRSVANRYRNPISTQCVYSLQYNTFNLKKLRIRAAINYWRFYKGMPSIKSDVPVLYFFAGKLLSIIDLIKGMRK